MRAVQLFVAFFLGIMVASLSWAQDTITQTPREVCVPLYDKSPLECWYPSADCPAPPATNQKGE